MVNLNIQCRIVNNAEGNILWPVASATIFNKAEVVFPNRLQCPLGAWTPFLFGRLHHFLAGQAVYTTVDVSFQTPGVDRYTWKGSEITTLVRTLLDLTKSVQNLSCCESMGPTAGVHTYHSPRCKTSHHDRTLSFKLRPIKDWSIPFQYTRDSSSSADFIIFLWSCLVFISGF